MDRKNRPVLRLATVGAVVLGLAAGSYGVASAASGSSSAAATGLSASGGSSPNAALPAQGAPSASNPWGAQRSDETLLTSDTAAKVREAALAKVPGGTIVRVETDADGHAAYEAHMVGKDGKPVTVYVDEQFDVVSVQ
jgi:hypothetical protein